MRTKENLFLGALFAIVTAYAIAPQFVAGLVWNALLAFVGWWG